MKEKIHQYLDANFGIGAKCIYCMYSNDAGLLKEIFGSHSNKSLRENVGFSEVELLKALPEWIENFKTQSLDVSQTDLTTVQLEVLELMQEKFQSQIEITAYSEEKLIFKLWRYTQEFELTSAQARELCAYIVENRRKQNHAT